MEWDKAKPFDEIPTMGALQFLMKFLPGGKYSKMDSSQMMLAFREDIGPIGRLKIFPGRPYIVFTHNPQDFEKVFRNEGIWPVRPGFETSYYHRSVHQANFFQGIEGLIGT